MPRLPPRAGVEGTDTPAQAEDSTAPLVATSSPLAPHAGVQWGIDAGVPSPPRAGVEDGVTPVQAEASCAPPFPPLPWGHRQGDDYIHPELKKYLLPRGMNGASPPLSIPPLSTGLGVGYRNLSQEWDPQLPFAEFCGCSSGCCPNCSDADGFQVVPFEKPSKTETAVWTAWSPCVLGDPISVDPFPAVPRFPPPVSQAGVHWGSDAVVLPPPPHWGGTLGTQNSFSSCGCGVISTF